jgi:hypothetical protein
VVCPHLQEDPFEKKVIEARTSSVPGEFSFQKQTCLFFLTTA